MHRSHRKSLRHQRAAWARWARRPRPDPDGDPPRPLVDVDTRLPFDLPLGCCGGRNPYQVRHTYASGELTAGANPWYIAQQLGHVDVQMVFRVYGKFIRADFARPRLELVRPTGS